MTRKDTGKIDWDPKPRTPKKEFPHRHLGNASKGTRGNADRRTLRGPLLGVDRRSKKNPHHTDLDTYHKKGGTRRRRYTRRR